MTDSIDLHIHINVNVDIIGHITNALFNELVEKDKIFQKAYFEFKDVVNRVYEEAEENRKIDNIVYHCLTGE